MKKILSVAVLILIMSFETHEKENFSNENLIDENKDQYVLVIHGGAGNIERGKLSPEMEARYEKAMQQALKLGAAILEGGGTAIDAVEAAIVIMENDPIFNAGKGAVFTNAGTNELDASIMDGATLQAGAVAGVETIKNPIKAARQVMEQSPHVILIGAGAESFAESIDMEMVEKKYFFTEKRYRSLKRVQERKKQETELDYDADEQDIPGEKDKKEKGSQDNLNDKHGTVGAVALDKNGNLAAGTSTGGMTNKRWGRVGDSPIVAAGTYADNDACAVSATGHGEYFIRGALAYDIVARMKYGGNPVQEAAKNTIHDKLTAMGGTGGVICLDAVGNVVFEFNTTGMFRGYIKSSGEQKVQMYGK